MTLLPFVVGQEVLWRGQPGKVVQVTPDRVVVVTEDGMTRITTEDVLRAHQPDDGRGAA